MKSLQYFLVLLAIASSINASPVEPSFSSALKSSTTNTRGGKTAVGEAQQESSSPINSALLREFIGQFLRALRTTLSSSSSSTEEATNKLEQRQDAGTSRFRFPEAEQVKQYLGLPSSQTQSLAIPKSSRSGTGSVNMAKIERVTRPGGFGSSSSSSLENGMRLRTQTQVTDNENGNAIIRKARTDPNSEPPTKIGKPSTIMSQPLRIIDGPRDGKRGRSLKEIDVQGVKIIVGERVPDSPEDKFFTWRNARVIKGVLMPNSDGRTVKSRSTRVA